MKKETISLPQKMQEINKNQILKSHRHLWKAGQKLKQPTKPLEQDGAKAQTCSAQIRPFNHCKIVQSHFQTVIN